MRPSLRRLIIAILAWPGGIVAAIVWEIMQTPHADCPPGPACAVALSPVPLDRIVLAFVIALGPGIVATSSWWRRRHDPDSRQD
jgi:hypothetical protein